MVGDMKGRDKEKQLKKKAKHQSIGLDNHIMYIGLLV